MQKREPTILYFTNKKEKEGKQMKINWKEKLSSRKFWAAIAAWITSMLTAFGATDNAIARVSLIIAGVGTLTVYMLAEAVADKARTGSEVVDVIGMPVEGFKSNPYRPPDIERTDE